MPLIQYDVPTSRDSLLAALAQVDRQAQALWTRLPPEQFFATPERGWSPAQNIQHMGRSTAPVIIALRVPRVVPRLLFGKPRSPSRSFIQIRDTYRAALDAGAQAGRFGPRRSRTPRNAVAKQEALILKWRRLVSNLGGALSGCPDATLDHYRLPHPLIGKLTFREMLFFTLYHLGHHVEIVAERYA